MAKVMKSFLMEQYIQVHMPMENHKDMARIPGRMAKPMKGNGLMEWRADQEFGEDQMAILILDNGVMDKQMAMEFIHGLMEIDMKDNLRIA